jgi:intracellular sulfur oxidation DsrE/DsrF family protein
MTKLRTEKLRARKLRACVQAVVTGLFAVALASGSWAQQPQVPLQDKPFAEHKVVLQLSDSDPHKQALVISVANNLLKFYDPDKVAIEVVTFGPGIDLLRGESASRKQVESLISQGVRFDVCLNTVDTLELFLIENGYTLVKP